MAPEQQLNSEQRFVLITGASSGIGRSCAEYLAGLGFIVFAGVRQEKVWREWQEKRSGRIIPLLLDITNQDQTNAAVHQVQEYTGGSGLTGLINNAGLVVAGPLEFLPLESIRKQLEVNVIGQVAVTQAFLPLLRIARGRIVNMGSIAGRSTLPITGPYNASKHALEALTDALRMELSPWNIHVSIIEPGVIRTPIWSKSVQAGNEMQAGLPEESDEYYGARLASIREYVLQLEQRGHSPDGVIRAVEHALTARRPKTRYVVGWDARLRLLFEKFPDRWRDWLILKVLGRMDRQKNRDTFIHQHKD